MQDCMEQFIVAIQEKCDGEAGTAVIDFARLNANLTFVSTLLHLTGSG